MIAQCEAFEVCEMETELFFFRYSCWEYLAFGEDKSQSLIVWNYVYTLPPFQSRVTDHIFAQLNILSES